MDETTVVRSDSISMPGVVLDWCAREAGAKGVGHLPCISPRILPRILR